ncbi:hypothetical protein HanLR1_Chr10g0382291 [Helianthus annuus]|nr:hypothetical protein HanLR1_Chr10g0382291 [Helianthus annuus]
MIICQYRGEHLVPYTRYQTLQVMFSTGIGTHFPRFSAPVVRYRYRTGIFGTWPTNGETGMFYM